MNNRITKVNDLLRDEIGQILLTELRGNGEAIVTVTRADTSPSLEHATIYLSVLPAGQARAAVGRARQQIYFLQQALNKRLKLRIVPKIRFEPDRSGDHVARIEQILEKAGK